MIGYLRGTLLVRQPGQLIVETNGVGYEVLAPVSTFTALPEAGSEVRLYVYTHVREDALALFGFATVEEKALFEKLISVSGIGPKLAITVLSGLRTGELITAIRMGAVDQLVRIPGVGKKTAERIVLELKDKLDLLPGAAAEPAAPPAGALSNLDRDVLSALMNLGCQRAAAEVAVRKARAAGAPDEFEPLFRRALELVR